MIMRPPIKYALQEQGVGHTSDTKESYRIIFTYSFNLVKQIVKRIVRSFLNDEMSGATPHHFQGISDIDGEQAHVTLEESVVSIVDKQGGTAQLSAYLVPELRATLLDVEKKFGRRFIS